MVLELRLLGSSPPPKQPKGFSGCNQFFTFVFYPFTNFSLTFKRFGSHRNQPLTFSRPCGHSSPLAGGGVLDSPRPSQDSGAVLVLEAHLDLPRLVVQVDSLLLLHASGAIR